MLCKSCVTYSTGAKLERFEGRFLSNKKVHTKHFLWRMYLEIIFFKCGNNGALTGSFEISLPSCIPRLLVGLFNKNTVKFQNPPRKGLCNFQRNRACA